MATLNAGVSASRENPTVGASGNLPGLFGRLPAVPTNASLHVGAAQPLLQPCSFLRWSRTDQIQHPAGRRGHRLNYFAAATRTAQIPDVDSSERRLLGVASRRCPEHRQIGQVANDQALTTQRVGRGNMIVGDHGEVRAAGKTDEGAGQHADGGTHRPVQP